MTVRISATQETSDKAAVKGFAQMSLATMQRIVSEQGGYHELAAYIVLCSGVNARNGVRYCTHGAKSVSTRTGLGYMAAEKAIKWLHQHGVISPPTGKGPQHAGSNPSRSQIIRWVVNDSDGLDVAVSRQFIEGVNPSNKSGLLRIVETVSGDGEDISRKQAIVDVLLLYAALMRAQDFEDCAGVDPDVWHQAFEPDDEADIEQVIELPNSNAIMATVREADSTVSSRKFIQSVLGGDPSDEAAWEKTVSRFWLAVQHLQNLHIIYRVLVLWHGNPLDPKQRRNAEPIATQYIHDRWAREIDPHLQYEANKAAWRMEARDVGTDLGGRTRGEGIPFIGSGSYRYIVKATAAEHTFLVGQFRVRYWPSNQTTVTGRAVEKQRTLKFMKAIKNLL